MYSLSVLKELKSYYGVHKGAWGNTPKTKTKLAVEEAQYILMRNLKKEVCHV